MAEPLDKAAILTHLGELADELGPGDHQHVKLSSPRSRDCDDLRAR